MIGVIVALAAEARPLIDYFRLKSVPLPGGFRAFANDRIFLLQCGMGKAAAAAGVAYAQAWSISVNNENPVRAWLNIGIAGHRSRNPGKCIIAHKVIDQSSGQSWYPALVFDFPGESALVATVDKPQQTFPDDAVYEMEASGFYATACRFASAELVSVIKIISDNHERPFTGLTKETIHGLVRAALPAVESVLTEQHALIDEMVSIDADPEYFAEVLQRFHVTQSQRRQLRRALQRFAAFGCDELPHLREFKNIKSLLAWLEHYFGAAMAHYRLD